MKICILYVYKSLHATLPSFWMWIPSTRGGNIWNNTYNFLTLILIGRQLYRNLKVLLMPAAILIYLYTNTVLGGSVRLWACLPVCSYAIKTTFPLFNFKTKHIFGILMVLWKFEDHLGRRRRPNFFLPPTKAPQFFIFLHRGWHHLGVPMAPRRRRSPGGLGKRRPRRLFRDYIFIYM